MKLILKQVIEKSIKKMTSDHACHFSLYAGHGIYLGGESPLWGRCRNCQPLANIKGVYREMESERRWRQSPGPRNTNHIRHIIGTSVQNNTKS